ncbi:hypothetical protein [Salinarimonas soli]|nr:hypothetical protein [Salinarimonas soli]
MKESAKRRAPRWALGQEEADMQAGEGTAARGLTPLAIRAWAYALCPR